MHLLFIALLVFGVNWQKKVEPQVNIVDLWSPPSATPPQAAPPPPPLLGLSKATCSGDSA